MVSQISWFGRLLAVMLLLLCLTTLTLTPDAAWAKNRFTYTDGHEGDPGDGVLNPAQPAVDPDPVLPPKGDSPLVFFLTFVDRGDGQLIPILHLRTIGRQPGLRMTMPPISEGRWHRAP